MENTKTVKIEGMGCVKCAAKVQAALEAVKGVKCAEVDLEGKKATVVLLQGSDTHDNELKTAVEERGYTVISVE